MAVKKKPVTGKKKLMSPLANSGSRPGKKKKDAFGSTIVYQKAENGLLPTNKRSSATKPGKGNDKALQKEMENEYLQFRKDHIAILQGIPAFTLDVYTYCRTSLLASDFNSVHYNNLLDLSLYFGYLVDQYKNKTPWHILHSFKRYVEEYGSIKKQILPDTPVPDIEAPDTITIANLSITIPDTIKDMYVSYVRDTRTFANPISIDIFMMAHTPKAFTGLVTGLIDNISCLNPDNVIEKWGFMDDYCVGTALQAIADIDIKDDPNVLKLLRKAAFYLNYRADFIERSVNPDTPVISPEV